MNIQICHTQVTDKGVFGEIGPSCDILVVFIAATWTSKSNGSVTLTVFSRYCSVHDVTEW